MGDRSTRRAVRIVGGCLGLLGGLAGLAAETLNIGILDGAGVAMAALGILDFGPEGVPSGVAAASVAGTGGLVCSVLVVTFAAPAILTRTRWPSVLLIAAAVAGWAIGGSIAAPGMLVAILGGVLALVGAGGPACRRRDA
jgi:hypothetical protein